MGSLSEIQSVAAHRARLAQLAAATEERLKPVVYEMV